MAPTLLGVLGGGHHPILPPLTYPLPHPQIYLSGHGGEDFLKFQGVETLTSTDITDALSQMAAQGRFGSLLFIADTCKAASLFTGVAVVPHVVTVASSKSGACGWVVGRCVWLCDV